MSDPQTKAAFYFSPTLDALWRWSGDGEALLWADGTTIAFRAEILNVLSRIAPGGFPPFGAIALLLAATRDGWPESQGRACIEGYTQVFGGMKANAESSIALAGPSIAFGRVAREI